MVKRLMTVLFLLAFTGIITAQQQNPTKVDGAEAENYLWYEFKIQQLRRQMKVYAFKTDEQRNNRTAQLFNAAGWGMGPNETITEFYNFRAGEKTRMWDAELKPMMKKEGYKYAFTTYRITDKDLTKIFLYTFYYDKDKDELYMLKSSK